MSGTYKIKGTLQVSCTVGEIQFSIFPDTTYLSPDKQSAVLYSDNAETYTLKLDCADKKYLLLGTPNVLVKKDFLVQIALQNKPVELHVDKAGKTITGFTYPAR